MVYLPYYAPTSGTPHFGRREMRTLSALLAAIFFALSGAAIAQQSDIEEIWPDAEFGTYGYLHQLLHHHGAVQEIIDLAGHNCCDGGAGGECRATQIWRQSPISYFKYLDYWCPIDVPIHTMTTLPTEVTAIVCAGKVLFPQAGPDGVMQMCPGTHCAGDAPLG